MQSMCVWVCVRVCNDVCGAHVCILKGVGDRHNDDGDTTPTYAFFSPEWIDGWYARMTVDSPPGGGVCVCLQNIEAIEIVCTVA